ncbi:uncharacterized protein L201_002379 [Kwoniella dendrophila CBS 6074]|uniref:F-box domain-containing protein n=1 Tax=Kwoniella dendrophila CBS 6074 TaxID=1295534 RepID=A0AAX4JRV5_9TREE
MSTQKPSSKLEALPLDIFDKIFSVLESTGSLGTLATFAQCSQKFSLAILPYLYRCFSLNAKSVNSIFPLLSTYLKDRHSDRGANATNDSGLNDEVDQTRNRILKILSSIQEMISDPINPKSDPEAAELIARLMRLIEDQPLIIFPNLKILRIIAPSLASSQTYSDILEILGHTLSPSFIDFRLNESACGYASFREFLNYPFIKMYLKKLVIHNMHTSYLPKPSNVRIEVSFRDHLCTPNDQYDPKDENGGIWQGERCDWDCDKKFCKVILHHIQSYPEDKDYPPLIVFEETKAEEQGELSDLQFEPDSHDNLGGFREKDDEDIITQNDNPSSMTQMDLMSSKLQEKIIEEANDYRHNKDGTEETKLENIRKWRKRVIFMRSKSKL